MIKASALIIVVLGSFNLVRAEIGLTRNLNDENQHFTEEVQQAKEITEIEKEIEEENEEREKQEWDEEQEKLISEIEKEEEEKAKPNFVHVHPSDPPELENPHNFPFLHRPIPPFAKTTPADVRANSVLIEGATTGVRTKVPLLSEENREKYGVWMFFDGYKEEFDEDRPVMDFSMYPSGDAPAENFPPNSWQSDAVYLMHFLDNAQKLIDRSREAIYEEYGYPVSGISEERDKSFGFRKGETYDDLRNLGVPIVATKTEFDGLVRRLLHAMMTNQEFKVALNGHSVAAGHDSNFWQSYIHQFHHVMEPIFTRLGMKLSTYNYGRGGLGTFQDTMAGTDTLGDPDVLMWDSGMTEGEPHIIDAFHRQAIMSGTRVPFFIHPQHKNYPGEIAYVPASEKTMPMTPMDLDHREDVPYAARYMQCETSEMSCNRPERKFNKGCWDDGITDFVPPTTQKKPPFRGQHPSWRWYQLQGRNIALLFLHALEEAVEIWQDNSIEAAQLPLDGEHWHVTDLFTKIRQQTQESAAESPCMTKMFEPLKKVCTVPMRGRSEFTGRANPNRTALRSIVRPTVDGYVPFNEKQVVYDKPITIPWQTIPEGEVDVRAIVGAGKFDDRRLDGGDFETLDAVDQEGREAGVVPNTAKGHSGHRSLRSLEDIVPGKGWQLQRSAPAGYCDGSTDYHSCNRQPSNNCLANDHQDTRTGIFGDQLSGWLMFDIDNVVEGFVVLKFETWHKGEVNPMTKDWTSINNEGEEDERLLKKEPKHWWPDEFEVDVAINGVITIYNRDMIEEKMIQAQRVVQLMVLHDKKPAQPEDMEVAIRIRCAGEENREKHLCNINISHLYWA